MRVIFVNRFYWPEIPATGQLLTDLAEGLAADGLAVTVITSAADHLTPRRESRSGVDIIRVGGTRWARTGTLGKAVDFGTFYLGALWHLLRAARPGTVVVPMTDPPLLGLGAWLAARGRRARLIHWIQDIYPEIAIALFGHRWLRLLRPLRNLAWRRADHGVTLGTDMAQALHAAGVAPDRISIAANWGPREIVPLARTAPLALRRDWNLTGKFVVAYSGNLGRVHDLQPVVALADALRDSPEIALILIGDGAQRRDLESAARAKGLGNLAFHPPQPRDRLSESLAVGDLHLVTLLPGCEHFVFPSKLYGIAAAGRPILFIGPTGCEVARCVIDNRLGCVAARDDIAGLAAAVRRLAADPQAWADHAAAATTFAARHSAANALRQWRPLLEATSGSPRANRASNRSSTA